MPTFYYVWITYIILKCRGRYIQHIGIYLLLYHRHVGRNLSHEVHNVNLALMCLKLVERVEIE